MYFDAKEEVLWTRLGFIFTNLYEVLVHILNPQEEPLGSGHCRLEQKQRQSSYWLETLKANICSQHPVLGDAHPPL